MLLKRRLHLHRQVLHWLRLAPQIALGQLMMEIFEHAL